MILMSETAVRDVETAIVNATHTATDTAGDRVMLATIDSAQLRSAALIGLQIATGQLVWPPGDRLVIKTARRSAGPLEIEER